MQPQTPSKILVTGASSYVGTHIVRYLLSHGLQVKGGIKLNSSHSDDEFFQNIPNVHLFEICQLELMDRKSIFSSVSDVSHVVHLAGPYPTVSPKDPIKVIKPTMMGVRYVLEAILESKVKRLVYVSSFLTSYPGNLDQGPLNEEVFAKIDNYDADAIERSRIYAEEEVKEFIREHGKKIEVVILSPSMIVGPIISKKFYPGLTVITKHMNNEIPGYADVSIAMVDVRDVAVAVHRALVFPDIAGEKFIISNRTVSIAEVVDILKNKYSKKGYVIPSLEMPTLMLKMIAMVDKELVPAVNLLGKKVEMENNKSINVLKMEYRGVKEMIEDTTESLIAFGFIKRPAK